MATANAPLNEAFSHCQCGPIRFSGDENASFDRCLDPGHKIPGQFTFDRKFDGNKHTTPESVLYIVSGGGGNPGLHSPKQTDNPKTWQPFTVRYNASLNQFTLMEIDGRRLTLRQLTDRSLDDHEMTLQSHDRQRPEKRSWQVPIGVGILGVAVLGLVLFSCCGPVIVPLIRCKRKAAGGSPPVPEARRARRRRPSTASCGKGPRSVREIRRDVASLHGWLDQMEACRRKALEE